MTATVDGSSPNTLFGTSVRRVEDPHLLRGETSFVANVPLEGALVVHYVTSIEAHARIADIDVSAALASPGVVDVVTAADIDLGPPPPLPPDYPEGTARPYLAADIVRYVGQPIVAIVAESEAAAEDAAELVEINYEPLPPVIGFEAALANKTRLFDHLDSNLVHTATNGNGAIDFSVYEVVVQAVIENQRLAPCPIETRVAACYWDGDRIVQYASCQGAHVVQKMLAYCYGLEPSSVRVITSDVGGSFGAKGRPYSEDLLLPFLSRRSGRPVRWTPTRSQDMVGLGHSRAQRNTIRIAGDRDGTLRAMEADILIDCGAYPVAGPVLAQNTGRMMPGPFDVERVNWVSTAVVTNTTPLAAYRGAGRPESGALVDRAVDLFAAEIGMDPATLRRKNLMRADQLPFTNPSGVIYDSGDYHDAFERCLEIVGFDAFRAEQATRRGSGSAKQLGLGLSTFIDRTAGAPGSEYGSIELKEDGSLRVLTGSSPYGQGHYTTWAQLVSERTGVPVGEIEIFHGDTDVVPRGGVTGGSRSAQKAGSAIAIATDDFVTLARRQAADLLEASVDDIVLDFSAARFHVAGSPGASSVGWAELASAHAASDEDWLFGCAHDFDGEGPTVPYGAYAVVVEVDTETGMTELLRVVTVDDAGAIINPMIALGQVHGGLAQGIAQALYEEFVYDSNGNPLTSSFLDYAIPSAAEMIQFESSLTQHPSPNNPLGCKGIAESGTIGGVPAVQNAVIDALSHLGVKHIDLPLTPQRVWRAINDQP